MDSLESADGVEIAYERYGEGRPLVLVHGSNDFKSTWQPIRPLLEDDFELFAMDRRGRGASGDADGYVFDREVEDVLAVIEAAKEASDDEQVALWGHSFGGVCALEAARRTDAVAELILHEPPVLLEPHREAHTEMAAQLTAQASEDSDEAALKWFLREGLGLPEPMIANMPMWDQRVGFADATRRELDAVMMYRPPETPKLGAETLVLWGSESPAHLRETADELADRIADSEVRRLDGRGHLAHALAPDAVADEVLDFLG
ncbi:alpha/beta fold hydrolase [Halorussus lipolyticus]|uniref:alpha/beta fold hydrolase n=1 Tax=Halorussus lipolyticus TaxID=3034024 RepID=UPI0023E77EAB|nr:alpha/beta hydrolase [Halorussus sp. DT80]